MNASTDTLLEVTGVKLRFGEKVILDDVQFSLQPKEVLVIMGISGCGKSTLLKIILGLLKAQAGIVLFQNTDLMQLSTSRLNDFRKKSEWSIKTRLF